MRIFFGEFLAIRPHYEGNVDGLANIFWSNVDGGAEERGYFIYNCVVSKCIANRRYKRLLCHIVALKIQSHKNGGNHVIVVSRQDYRVGSHIFIITYHKVAKPVLIGVEHFTLSILRRENKGFLRGGCGGQ